MTERYKYVLFIVLLIVLFFAGRWSKPDADLSVWEKEKQTILKQEQNKRDSLHIIIENRDRNIILLEEKDSVSIATIDSLGIIDREQDRKLRKAYSELRKLGSKELEEFMTTEYEKYNN